MSQSLIPTIVLNRFRRRRKKMGNHLKTREREKKREEETDISFPSPTDNLPETFSALR